jgi:peptidoglycan/LPS O-acetylase OafA/YrhL
VGVVFMVLPMATYDSRTPFPGLNALPPVLGAMLVIWSTSKGSSLLKTLLSWKPVVFVGLISYSLYLWHWPVMVYSHYWITETYSPWVVRVWVVLVSYALAIASWRYVETPFRTKKNDGEKRRSVVTPALAASCAIVVIGGLISQYRGLPQRFPAEIAASDRGVGSFD